MLRTITRAAVAAALSFAVAAPATAQAQTQDIVATAVAAGQFTTLAKALTEAGLVETLQGAGPFTVFAPTDAAFAKLPAGALEGLLADKAKLRLSVEDGYKKVTETLAVYRAAIAASDTAAIAKTDAVAAGLEEWMTKTRGVMACRSRTAA